MMKRLTIILSCTMGTAAMADEATKPSAYRAVMDAQYAARQQPLPARPEEAQRIYENYLQSIGKPARDLSGGSDTHASAPSR